MNNTPNQRHNLIHDDITSLAQYGLHYRDADEPIITNTLPLLLHEHPDRTFLDQPHTNRYVDLSIPFTIIGNIVEHTPCSLNHELHQWLKVATHPSNIYLDNNSHSPHTLLYEVKEVEAAAIQASASYQHNMK